METSCFCLKQVRMDDVRGYLVVSVLEKCGSWGHDPVGEWRMTLAWWSRCCTLTGYLSKMVMNVTSTTDVNKKQTKKRKNQHVSAIPLWLKMPSISMEDLEWAMQSMEQGTRPSRAGDRSVVLTRHQSGLSWQRSRTSTVWPRRTVSSLLLLAMKSCITTVSSQPPESWRGKRNRH